MLRGVTVWIIVATAVVWIVWDLVVYFGAKNVEATFSRVIWDWSHHPLGTLLVLAMGVLMGHFFYSARRLDLLAVFAAGVVGGAAYWGQKREKPSPDDGEGSEGPEGPENGPQSER